MWAVLARIRWRLGKTARIKRLHKVRDAVASRRMNLKAVIARADERAGRTQLEIGETPVTRHPERFLTGAGECDLEQVAACLGVDTLAWWGQGARSVHHGHPGVSIESAAGSADRLTPQLVGTLASWVASKLVAAGDPLPVTPQGLADKVAHTIQRAGLLDEVGPRIQTAMDRHAVRSAVKYDLGAAVGALRGR